MGLEKIKNNNNYIHHTSIIGENVTMGSNNYVGPYCIIIGDTTIGDNNRFESYCSIGSPAESIGYFESENGKLYICSNNLFREFITINAGTTKTTKVGNNVIMLRGTHVGHDAVIENKVNLSCNTIIGGFTHVMEGVNMGLGTITHQLLKIGAYSMIGMGTIITKKSNIKPGGVYVGNPARYIKDNIFGLEKNNISLEYLEELNQRYNELMITR